MRRGGRVIVFAQTLNESPSEKEGKFTFSLWVIRLAGPLNESPSEKEGKSLQATL